MLTLAAVIFTLLYFQYISALGWRLCPELNDQGIMFQFPPEEILFPKLPKLT